MHAAFRVVYCQVTLLAFFVPVAVGQDQTNTDELLSHISGYLIRTRGASEIVALKLPQMKESLVCRTAPADADLYPTIHAMSGPDGNGRIAYVEDHFFNVSEKDRKHLLKVIKIDGTDVQELFSRSGSAMWATTRAGRGEIGTHLALAPSGTAVALLRGLVERQMPRALLYEGDLEIWDIAERRQLKLTTKAINQPMSWFPDGKRLACVKLVPRSELPEAPDGLEKFGNYFGEIWDQVPVIHVVNIETGESKSLHVGWTPIVSRDGKAVFVGGWDNHAKFTWNRFDLESRVSSAVRWPGDASGLFAAPSESLVLYTGPATADGPIESTRNDKRDSSLAVRIAAIDSNNSQSVGPTLDIRDLISFGQVGNTGPTASTAK